MNAVYTLINSLVFSLTLGLFQASAPTPVNEGHPLSVCEVLHNLAKYRGKVIEIRGEWDGGLKGKCPALRTGSYEWPNYILVESVSDAIVTPIEATPTWKGLDMGTYWFALKGVQLDLSRLSGASRARAEIVATVVGLLDTTDPPLAVSPSNEPRGYGHLNAYPAHILLLTLKDIALTMDGKILTPLPKTAPVDR